jgi:predicted PurR-regulated permease PerM
METGKSNDSNSKIIRKRILRVEVAPITIINTVLIVSAAWLLVYLLPVLLILVASLMIVGTLSPAVQWVEARGLRRGIAIAIIFSVLLLIILLLVTLTIPALIAQVTSLIEQEPELRARVVKFLASYQITASFANTLRNFQYGALIESSGSEVFAFSRRLLEIIAYSAGAVFLALYIMIDGDRLRGAVFAVVPRSHHIRLSRILINLQTIVGGYLRGQLITCLFMGLFLFALLKACGIPNAMAFALFGGIADVLPFIGIFLTIGPAVLAALAKGPVITTIVLVALLCYEEFESRFLIPVVYGRALRLPSSVVLFSLIAGGTLYGIVGALLALPMAATILMLIDELRVELPGEGMQAQDLKLKKIDERSEAEYVRRTEGMPAEEAAAVAVEISNSRRNDESDSKP